MAEFEPSPELLELGLTAFFAQQFVAVFQAFAAEGSLLAGRISTERRGEYYVSTAQGTRRAALTGRLVHELSADERPAVGDWVAIVPSEPLGRVVSVLERSNILRRREVGSSSRGQALAANVDVGFVVAALSTEGVSIHAARHALNPRRIERYLRLLHECHIPGVVVVNKSDLQSDAEALLQTLREELPNVEVILVSARTGTGVAELQQRIGSRSTAVFLGSSGVGKSSLANQLLGEDRLRTGSVREDDARGRHTTRERELVVSPGGGILIDTPGMRELALFAEGESESTTSGFSEIDDLAPGCRFRDCTHESEPGCAVQQALRDGTLTKERVEHEKALERELAQQRERADVRLRQERQKKSRSLSRALRTRVKQKSGGS
jgi:ribosome biogenesis GTPase